MDPERPRRLRDGWILGLIFLAFVLPPAALGLSIRALAERRWKEMEGETRKQEAHLRARDLHRPILRGEPLPGNACKDYEDAEGLLGKSDGFYRMSEFLEGRGDLRREEIQAKLEPYLPALDALRRGTRRPEAPRRPSRDERVVPQVGSWRLTTLGICRARFLAEARSLSEAVSLLLDLFQYAGDRGRDGSWFEGLYAITSQGRVLTELKSLMSVGLLERGELLQMSRELGLLEGAVPSFGEGMVNSAMERGFQIMRTKTLEKLLAEFEILDRKLSAWRYGGSEELMLSKHYELQLWLARCIAEGDTKSWSEARQITAEACEALAASGNPLDLLNWTPKSKPDYTPILSSFRELRAQLRLLRAAAQFRAEGVVPDLDDPFGDKLRSARSGPVLKLWSVGPDGVDNGGSGGWTAKQGRDIVIEVRR
jgi:hypothetical protein